MRVSLLSCVRREVFAAVLLLAMALFSADFAFSADASGPTEAVAQAAEKLRLAMLEGDELTLNALTDEHLTYGHSQGMIQNRSEFVRYLVGPKAPGKFNAISLSEQSIQVLGDVAVIRHTFDAENARPDGSTSKAHIHGLQVWKQDKAGWKLVARQACPLKI